ncbi:MAG: LysM peptidoglycan-binding domain-containing protein [Kiritimatiellia bacterium]|jgi:tetratricopeptide (TPR) repeat protein
MQSERHARRYLTAFTGLYLVLFFAGCGALERPEERDPHVRRAREQRAAGDYAGSLDSYQKALDRRPQLARVHWEMGSIYDQFMTNELRAIYHYQRYLELDPDAERRQLVEQLIGAARMSYAASLPNRPSEAIRELARYKAEVSQLREALAEAQQEVAALKGIAPPSGSAAVPAPRMAPAQPAATETYTVKEGDTLSRIASKVYGDTGKWDVLFEANRHILSRPESVRPGQVLVVPR